MASPATLPMLTVPESAEPPAAAAGDRLTTLFQHHFDLVWRTVRRLGVPPEGIDDAAQEVFVVASRRLDAIEPGKEKAFLYGTAVRVAAGARRAQERRRRAPVPLDELDPVDTGPSVADLLDQKRARELLDQLVLRLGDDTRPVFVLYELEGLTMEEIAACLGLPLGTVASRLRRGREAFNAAIARIEAARKEVRRG